MYEGSQCCAPENEVSPASECQSGGVAAPCIIALARSSSRSRRPSLSVAAGASGGPLTAP